MHHCTLQKITSLSGVGLHSGEQVNACLMPSAHPGIVFTRADLPGKPIIPADWRHVARTVHATALEYEGVSVSTTEHLLAALWSLGVTACIIELDGPEVPILDGSAAPWVEVIQRASLEPLVEAGARPIYRLNAPVWIGNAEITVLGVPYHEFRLTCAVEYAVPNSRQVCDFVITPETFAAEIAPTRTFTLQSWIEPLRAQGLIRGGSLENALVLDENGASAPLRFADELARHKALDVLGDLALLFAPDGGILQAHIIAQRAGHGPHRAWMEAALAQGALTKAPL
jgi:UDP-3-O-[3-hydroxymyristoyl] N-acetylglucosamine deacetylase